jgi:hypothetical protein
MQTTTLTSEFLSAYPGFDKYQGNKYWVLCVQQYTDCMGRLNAETDTIDDLWQSLKKEGYPEDAWRMVQKQANQKRQELGKHADDAYACITNFDPSNYQ